MPVRKVLRFQMLLASLAVPFAVFSGACGTRAEETQPAQSNVEEIFVLRSVRESRGAPSEVCAQAAGKLQEPAWEDQYTFRTVATRDTDGRVTNSNVATVGSIRACFGKTKDANLMELYGGVTINGIAGKAFGKCHTAKRDFPEKGVSLFGCLFELYDLPPEYTGGQLTTNSASSSQLFGLESNPPGYTQVSIATIRLWRKR